MGIVKPASFTAGRRVALGGSLAVPVLAKGATNGAGGAFAADTYFWKLTAATADGETTGSNEITAVVGANGTQVLTWAPVLGSIGYILYRGNAGPGTENVQVALIGPVLTYTDTGLAGTPSTPPIVNTADRVYEPGDSVPNSLVKSIRHLSALLNRRFLVPNVDPFRRKVSGKPTPTDISAKMKKDL